MVLQIAMSKYFAILLLAFSGSAIGSVATGDRFDCVVTAAHSVTADGIIVDDTRHLKSQIGSTFYVERETGAIRGGYFINNENSETVSVTNEPSNNSYYVVSTSHGPIKMVGYLYIANNRKWNQKPFTYTGAGEYVYSGYCK